MRYAARGRAINTSICVRLLFLNISILEKPGREAGLECRD
ncbi:hypothetical protein CIT292_10916 [Citrobacter youngae ATCC 29220]|uniref:Uncharacterized protein n=1 Tax=Citrobacter youngae ATCC 29220 TaxID=500640 RepID=D4BJS2_9ENTR|nr:hypothetical protein CIT292_10916 [Citrobacter youngae ATCC 29220]